MKHPIKKPLLYLAAPLFSEAERRFNEELRDLLVAESYEVYLPQESGESVDPKDSRPDRRTFLHHLEALRGADGLVAVCDGPDTDSGTSWEMGYAYALGIPVIALRTDRRRAAGGRILNLMLGESSMIATKKEEIVSLLEVILKK
ncbi:MAG: nucleoside 2-deoxyribosyltransferase [Methanomicrobiales archaeon]|nr:nucleoside 2-deoxyribosyltransferase [Methanomicrobiales archaeon]